jgi:hypothetical protein
MSSPLQGIGHTPLTFSWKGTTLPEDGSIGESMSDLETRVKTLETKLEQLSQAYGKELVQTKTMFFQHANRFEALLRYIITGKTLTMEQFLFALEEYQRFRTKIASLMKGSPSVVNRVNGASEYNKDAYFKIYADDVDVISQIEAAGGTTAETAELIMSSLPSTERLKLYMNKFLVQIPDPISEPGPDGFSVSDDKKESEN